MRRIYLVLLVVLLTSISYGQNSAISWWSLEGQYGYATTGASAVVSVVGEEAVGRMSFGNTLIVVGLLANQKMWGTVTAIHGVPFEVPAAHALNQNYPNPFNPNTVISYQLPMNSAVALKVYDVIGREVAILVNEKKDAGRYSVTWDAAAIPSGIYFYRLQAGQFTETKRMILMK